MHFYYLSSLTKTSMNEIGETLVEEVDRISELPDSILIQILLLIPTKDSVSTSVLSTRWNHLYASVPSLYFCAKDGNYEHYSNLGFPIFVTKVLNTVVQNLPSISKLRIDYTRMSTKTSNIISWIETAVLHSVQVLDVSVRLYHSGALALHCLFTSQTLVSLTLNLNFKLSIPDLVCMPKLKKLSMMHTKLSDESANKLFSSCPLLEDLSVMYWNMDNSKVLNVSVPLLKRLTLISSQGTECEILINCPKIEILACQTYGTEKYSGNVLETLKTCYIMTYMYSEQFDEGKQLLKLVKQVCKAQFLSLRGDTMEALLNPPCLLPTFGNLTNLELSTCYSEGWRLLSSLLGSSPRLKTLTFPAGFSDQYDAYNGVPFSPPEHVPICLSFHLKVIRINQFYGKEDEYKLVEYFLTNAFVLEKMVISPWFSGVSEEEGDPYVEVQEEGEEKENEEKAEGEGYDQWDGEEELAQASKRNFNITKRLLNFQRFSKVCEIIVEKSEEDQLGKTIDP